MSSMQAYLAAKYMSGPKADAILAKTSSGKKKKRKATGSTPASSSMIKDDDIAGWGIALQELDDDDGAADAVVAEDRGFKKRQRRDQGSGWATVREPTPPPPEDEQPQVVEESTLFKGGLLTSAQLKKTLPKKTVQNAEMTKEEIEAAQETIYRDASGRKVDMAVERAEAARRKREKEEKEAAKMEWGKGLVQKDEAEQRRKDHEAMRAAPFARTKEDVVMNEALKAEERWNDPAAAFLTKKRIKGPRKPEYAGPPPPPNRFAIKPGYRWDGVDRGNGFEKKFFQKQNERKRRGAEGHDWSVEDM
ncbi:Pre-mRNA-splicing factor of RES complex-domain-containing protein [Irpex rosettiformis]|uniref:Pre-mRNA-splicing factor of RES complex-domain-containing protein n=1 Tax=Irpex rosettiformis TaxID=378272 RepID=A0ACB8TZK0_9APHY|nr:Pre-mRNA-splicing factor of RES complex-domain-containing protein [Irpex rosettiformis]